MFIFYYFLSPGCRNTAPDSCFEGKTLPLNFFINFYLNEHYLRSFLYFICPERQSTAPDSCFEGKVYFQNFYCIFI
jgi:hypothetical protein